MEKPEFLLDVTWEMIKYSITIPIDTNAQRKPYNVINTKGNIIKYHNSLIAITKEDTNTTQGYNISTGDICTINESTSSLLSKYKYGSYTTECITNHYGIGI